MRLKSLELLGFKSFLNSTTISFASGMTAVVGPNGCGKSNVVDAIRWVLGEQAPTRLRGKSVEDLIYAGNDSNPAAGMAEVSLVLEAEERSLLPEPYSALSEVAVTRRAYRSGESEYLLNKIPCRLKDITEFFMAAQIHSRGYSLIEQGRIEEIIQAKPHELRTLVEEAAGLSLFKGRREMSERKLERVKENLARVDDVLSEIERQLNFARRQAKKAETYKIVKAELGELERYAAARRLIDQREELAYQTGRDAELKAALEQSREHVAAMQHAVETAASAAQSARSELGGTQRELENLHSNAQQRARSREFLEHRLARIAEHEPNLRARLAELDSNATLARANRALAGAMLAREVALGGGDGESELKELSARHDSAQSELKQAERRAEEFKDDLSDTIREAAVIRGRLGDLAGERAELGQRLDAIEIDTPAIAAALERARELMRIAEAELEACRASATGLEGTSRDAADREIEARAALEHLAARIAHRKTALNSRIEQTSQRPSSGAGLRLRTVLESLNGDRPATDPAILNDVVRAPRPLEPALRAVLGASMEAVIVESPTFALRAIEILKETRAGRLDFVQQPDSDIAAHAAIEAPGISGRLLDLLEVEPRFVQVAEVMLGHVMLADDLRSALAASNLNGHGTVFVTREGDLVWPGRMISGGSADDGQTAADLVAMESDMRDLARDEAEYQVRADQVVAIRAARERADAELDAARNRSRDAEKNLGDCRTAAAQAEQAVVLAEANANNSRRRLAEIAALIVASNARFEELALAEQEARARLAAIQSELAMLRSIAEQTGAAMLDAASKVKARKAHLNALENELAHARRIANDVEAQFDEHRASLERSSAERAEFERELETLAEQEIAARARQAEIEEHLTKLRSECDVCERALEESRAAHKLAQENLAALETEATECGLKRERARALSEEQGRAFAEKFGAEFDAIAAEIIPELDGRESALDDARIIELRGKIERIGEVNLAAESEVKELEERAGVLSTERADLQSALDDLSKTITHLNREARKRFAETFEGAAKNFAELFPKLLRGGKGRLELTDGGDVLEAGVNILVQPAGKKIKEIALLSGGEKALSAMALIFSLFLLNPSPFCVMDEVDAPLDEFSLAAFTSLMAELKERSQFIVITHNQRTMQRADQIHGITMDRPGVSKIISLKIPAAA
ncbi:MAG: chromosome segregation protein SMC [Candidatus Binatus sp.]|uniref:chromosome segregation protein SMC n=1 Tax=Candidatus Binatus sp. TaxID=2811406 RepID=UPI0027249A3C|nr:chromosome segregation protein SMC [Candidatus Binatus sp.]MDO8433115.1 chromosome segregation protein SMC [Candidatus Binatus sp.]